MTTANDLIRVMTYNAHSCVGGDGKRDVERVARVISETKSDVIALQEVEVDEANSEHQPEKLATMLGYDWHFTHTRSTKAGLFGNATLSRLPCSMVAEGSLPISSDERRMAHRLRMTPPEHPAFDVVNTHLSVHFRERLLQVRALLKAETVGEAIETDDQAFPALLAPLGRLVLCGDLNANGLSPVYRWIARSLRDAQKLTSGRPTPTFPAKRALLRIDHLWVGHDLGVERCFVPDSPLIRLASDHRPVIADLKIAVPERSAA